MIYIVSVGKILICITPSVQWGRKRREDRAWQRWVGFEAKAASGQCGAHSHLAHDTSTQVPTSQRRQKKVQDVSYPTWNRMNSLPTPSFYLELVQPLHLSCRRAKWSAASSVRPIEQAAFSICGPNAGSPTWAYKGKKMLDGVFLVSLSMEKKSEIRCIIGSELASWLC